MYFKTFTVSLIVFFSIANPVLGTPTTEDEILETSFNDCRKWLKKPSAAHITLAEFISYVGNFKETVNSILSHLKHSQLDAESQNKIHLDLYKELIKAICKGLRFSPEFFTKIRKKESDDKILEMSFDNCREWLKKPFESTIFVSEFFSYLEDGTGIQRIVDGTIMYLNQRRSGGADNYKIDLPLYNVLLRAICQMNGLSIEHFARIREKVLDDKILEKSFENCREWLMKHSEPIITLSDFLSYIGGCPQCQKIVVSKIQYLKDTQPDDINENTIDLCLYKELIESIRKVNGYPLDYFAKVKTDLPEDKILEKSFDDCRKWLKKPSMSTIKLNEFLSYAGNFDQTEESTLNYLKDHQSGDINKDEIDLGLYKELIREICKVNGLPLRIFIGVRKAVSEL